MIRKLSKSHFIFKFPVDWVDFKVLATVCASKFSNDSPMHKIRCTEEVGLLVNIMMMLRESIHKSNPSALGREKNTSNNCHERRKS